MFDPSMGAMWSQGVIDMKKVQCSFAGCGGRRIHHEKPDQLRPHQEFWVPATHPGPWYCSIECSVYAKAGKELGDDSPTEKDKDPCPEGSDSQGQEDRPV